MNIHIIGGGNLGVAIALGISKYTQDHQVTSPEEIQNRLLIWKAMAFKFLLTILKILIKQVSLSSP